MNKLTQKIWSYSQSKEVFLPSKLNAIITDELRKMRNEIYSYTKPDVTMNTLNEIIGLDEVKSNNLKLCEVCGKKLHECYVDGCMTETSEDKKGSWCNSTMHEPMKLQCPICSSRSKMSLEQIVMDIQQGAYNGNVTTEQAVEMIKAHFEKG